MKNWFVFLAFLNQSYYMVKIFPPQFYVNIFCQVKHILTFLMLFISSLPEINCNAWYYLLELFPTGDLIYNQWHSSILSKHPFWYVIIKWLCQQKLILGKKRLIFIQNMSFFYKMFYFADAVFLVGFYLLMFSCCLDDVSSWGDIIHYPEYIR